MKLSVLTAMFALTAAVTAISGWGTEKKTLRIESPAFVHNGAIPAAYTCDGTDASPPLEIGGVPQGAKSLALIVEDPDAPAGIWVHWVMWNIPPGARQIAAGTAPPGAVQGTNDWKRNGWGGPCPPSGTHRYIFRIFALDTAPALGPAVGKRGLERAMEGHILARGEIIGLYGRK